MWWIVISIEKDSAVMGTRSKIDIDESKCEAIEG